ncbi:MAG: DUF423 domain-containing protein [Methylococcales bacterium]|nr:DUF423 domain-containing protein [Methylococcales bacterium]MBT7445367.1 DUF423 domain-containing protein [Methylococcales bacterium]
MDVHKQIFRTGCLFLLTGILLGAFAAHGLKAMLSDHHLSVFQTAVTYQMYHGLGLLALSVCPFCEPSRLTLASRILTLGVLVFSGSLYALVLLKIPMLGMVTPFGGILMILGWALVLWSTNTKTGTNLE